MEPPPNTNNFLNCPSFFNFTYEELFASCLIWTGGGVECSLAIRTDGNCLPQACAGVGHGPLRNSTKRPGQKEYVRTCAEAIKAEKIFCENNLKFNQHASQRTQWLSQIVPWPKATAPERSKHDRFHLRHIFPRPRCRCLSFMILVEISAPMDMRQKILLTIVHLRSARPSASIHRTSGT